ncbi:MAG: lipid-A-disaccharide synthase N-terminal domain-containing protein [Planctomycetes bacterium]|nr:lipid-A-disaccharide synthase N-terminal domain-containing protein [Planctomycetota bacterium]MBU1518355.1 lipid-A-disaccharide synthase N-terminal domain-containing protein [Planctomycetota bacterium]MBU2457256.1 lipid-A-disaccharide synthase N-terminal domain-containing protein [Planctomycetota bacterium]MBU2596799.1 lipid-A-disaccharide synthase N-terminal domain-containing protein [Planctomycetota bacterium]
MFESLVKELSQEPVWTAVGFVGQIAFGGRFVLQWIASEVKKRSHVPIGFWYLSLVGSLILLAYSIHRCEPVFILGFSLNTVIYVRNLHLIYKHEKSGRIGPLEKDED